MRKLFIEQNKIRKIVNDLKEAVPCMDCHTSYPYWVMQFDHLPNRGKKRANISDLIRRKKPDLNVLLDEIQKCDILCANCHAERTYRRSVTKSHHSINVRTFVSKTKGRGSNPLGGANHGKTIKPTKA